MAKSFSDFDPTKTFITQTNELKNKEEHEIEIKINNSKSSVKDNDKNKSQNTKLKLNILAKEKKTKPVNLLMKPSTYNMIKEIANANDISINEAIHISIERLYKKL